jgi:tetratricopeptide (TPR) repeat protein
MPYLTLLLLLQAAPLPTIDELKFRECMSLAGKDAPSALVTASEWLKAKGGFKADACLGMAYASDFKFEQATLRFAEAARGAEAAKDARAQRFWAQAGNAAIAVGQSAEALGYLDKALAVSSLSNPERADALIDRARAFVATDKAEAAKDDLARARLLAPENGAAWLLSATLSRRMNALAEAQAQIKTAAALAPKDAAVALEAGNIAAHAGAYVLAREQWQLAVTLAPNGRYADIAARQLSTLQASEANGPATR